MKTTLILIVIFLQISLMAQVKIVSLHHPGSNPQFFSNEANAQPFQMAYAAAVDGDTIYITGGTYVPPTSFNKRLAIYGAGHFPSATTATQTTNISGEFNLGDQADGSHLEGLNFYNSINYPTNSVNDFSVKRCFIAGNVSAGSASGNYCLNNVYAENVIQGDINLNNLRSAIFSNNFIRGASSNLIGDVFQNNIFLRKSDHYDSGAFVIYYANATIFNNNIFIQTASYYSTQYILNNGTCTWTNNVFSLSSPVLGVDPILIGNTYGINMTDIFMNYTFNTPFNYSYDYHLKPAGLALPNTDGTQVGVYGGSAPFKDFSIPVNPHINSAVISQESNNGLLNVNIQVQAQSR